MRFANLSLLLSVFVIGCGDQNSRVDATTIPLELPKPAGWAIYDDGAVPFAKLSSDVRFVLKKDIELKKTVSRTSGVAAIKRWFALGTDEAVSEKVRFSHQAIFVDGAVTYDISTVAMQPRKVFCALAQKRYVEYPKSASFAEIDGPIGDTARAAHEKPIAIASAQEFGLDDTSFHWSTLPDTAQNRTVVWEEKLVTAGDQGQKFTFYCGYYLAEDDDQGKVDDVDEAELITMEKVLQAVGDLLVFERFEE